MSNELFNMFEMLERMMIVKKNGDQEKDKNTDYPIEHYFCKGITKIGINVVLKYFDTFMKLSGLPIISVGSGSGAFEKYLDEKFKTNIICVDPLKEIYIETSQKYQKKPAFPYVHDLIKINSHYIGNCMLILNWCEPNRSTYDYDAIKLLKPNFLFLITEPSGTASGNKFLNWLSKCGINVACDKESIDINPYQLIQEYHVDGKDQFGWHTWHTVAILANK